MPKPRPRRRGPWRSAATSRRNSAPQGLVGLLGVQCLGLRNLRTTELLLMIYSKFCITLRALSYGNHGIFLLMGNAGFVSSAVEQGLLQGIGTRKCRMYFELRSLL